MLLRARRRGQGCLNRGWGVRKLKCEELSYARSRLAGPFAGVAREFHLPELGALHSNTRTSPSLLLFSNVCPTTSVVATTGTSHLPQVAATLRPSLAILLTSQLNTPDPAALDLEVFCSRSKVLSLGRQPCYFVV